MFAQISLRDVERSLDNQAVADREKLVERAVESDTGNNGDENCRDRRHDGKQAHNLNMQPRPCPAAPPCLQHVPQVAADNRHQHDDGRAIDVQKCRDDVRSRHDWREACEHQKCDG